MRGRFIHFSRFQQALIFSLLLHFCLTAIIDINPKQITTENSPIKVHFLPSKTPEKKHQQIVSPRNQARESNQALKTKLLSDTSRVTAKEQIKRGTGAKNAIKTSRKSSQKTPAHIQSRKIPPNNLPQSKQKSHKSNTNKLKLTKDALYTKFAKKNPKPSDNSKALKPEREIALREAHPFFHTNRPGTLDFLPDIPDGDITLLNTKADMHSVFVYRVSQRVFGLLRQKNWASLTHRQLRQLENFSTVEASISLTGELVSARLLKSSGLPEFDTILLEAAREGTWDHNPPKTAKASNGIIIFVFQARSWSESRPSGGERRWIMMGTGLR